MRSAAAALAALAAAVASADYVLDTTDSRKLPAGPVYPGRLEHPLQLIDPSLIEVAAVGAELPAVSVSVTPTLIDHGDYVTITITSSSPSPSDWVGAYTPWPGSAGAPAFVQSTVPTKYAFLTKDPAYLTTGTATLSFQLYNFRAAVGFAAFTGGLTAPTLTASSPMSVAFRNYNAPVMPRVTATGSPDSARVLWTAISAGAPVVRWWPTVGGSNATATVVAATASTFPKSSLCGAPATTIGWFDLGTTFSATLTGLSAYAGRMISYTFGDAATGTYGGVASLLVPQAEGDASTPTRIIAYQDMGRGTTDDSFTFTEFTSAAINTTKWLTRDLAGSGAGTYSFVSHCGDVAYGLGYLSLWDSWLAQVAPHSSSVVTMFGEGNHESDWTFAPGTDAGDRSWWNVTDSGGECDQVMAHLLPFGGAATANAPWYAQSVGMIRLLSLSSEHDFSVGSPQWTWTQAQLAAVNRSVTPWVIVAIHRPLMIDSTFGGDGVIPTSDQDAAAAMRATLEPLFFAGRVNLVIQGHNHQYQRLSACYGGQMVSRSAPVDFAASGWKAAAGAPAGPTQPGSAADAINVHSQPQATVYMVVGSAGASFSVNRMPVPPAWSEFATYTYGYSRVHALNASHLYFEFVSDDTGMIMDRMGIVQDPFAAWHLPASGSNGLSRGAIAGIAIGGVAVLAVAAYFVRYRRSQVQTAAAAGAYASMDQSV